MSLLPSRDQLMQSWPSVFPGIDRVVLLFNEPDNAGISGQELVRQGNSYRLRTLVIDGLENLVTKGDLGYTWLHPDQLPFENKNTLSDQFQLFSEEQHVVLSLRLGNTGGMVDFFYLFFREDQSNFGVSRLQGPLDTARKALIGSVVFRMARMFYKSAQQFFDYIEEFTSVTRGLLENQSVDSEPVVGIEWISHWAEDFLSNYPLQPSGRWVLHESSLKKLQKAADFNAAKTALSKAAQMTAMLYGKEDDWTILPATIFFTTKQEVRPVEKSPINNSESRMSRTKQWLDNIETAAARLVSVGEEPTGAAVGQSLQRPVSAPAITDWLRKNQRRVMLLLNQYPEKWPVIREHFRPLTNLVQREQKMRQTG
ncbi:hypothetical protein ACT3CD_05880 [Geofilum sp. OHC36d9]|uniref:hypothetical protein n=1 Tax=Geofilum sp. OHC36d9 TaxID=3458413 RepID=UPI004034CD76